MLKEATLARILLFDNIHSLVCCFIHWYYPLKTCHIETTSSTSPMEPGTVLGLCPSSGAQSINAHSVSQVVRRLVAKSSLPLDQYCMEIFG